MATDRMALIRELSRHVGQPDFLEVAERIRRDLAATAAPDHAKPARAPDRALRRPSTTRRCA